MTAAGSTPGNCMKAVVSRYRICGKDGRNAHVRRPSILLRVHYASRFQPSSGPIWMTPSREIYAGSQKKLRLDPGSSPFGCLLSGHRRATRRIRPSLGEYAKIIKETASSPSGAYWLRMSSHEVNLLMVRQGR